MTSKLAQRAQKLFIQYLRENNLKVTQERLALLEEIFASNEHLDADELLARMKAKQRKVSRATVYRTLEVLEREVPQVRGKIAHRELSTPLSTRHFAGYEHGEIYGLEHTPARFRARALRPRTGLKGFYLTGQDVCTAGIAGALFGAILSASAILGRNLLGKM